MKIEYSIDGGETYRPAPEGLRVMIASVDVPGENSQGDLHVNFTAEGIVTDVWVDRESEAHNAGTSSETYDELVSRLVEDNS